MADAEKPLVYVVLGAAGSGRRAVVADLIEGGLGATDRPAVLVSDAEAGDATELPEVKTWKWTGEAIEGELPAKAAPVFFVADGGANPVDQIEAFKPWLEAQGGELARVVCVVNCRLAEQHPELLAWYEACVHFSDVVLLNLREGVENKWISDFQGHFKKQFLPALFEFVKDGRVKNPSLVLEPEPRRMSHWFETEADWTVSAVDGDELDEEAADGDEQEVELTLDEDPYLARQAGGRRVKPIPDVRKFLA